MPSFYPSAGHAHQQHAFEYDGAYSAHGYPFSHDGYDSCQPMPDHSFDFSMVHADPYNHYKRSAVPPASSFHGNMGYMNAGPTLPPPMAPPPLAPLRVDDNYGFNLSSFPRPNTGTYQYAEKKMVQEEKPVGGVSAKLDYDMEMMIDFVAESSTGMHELYRGRVRIADIDFIRSIKPGTQYSAQFRKWLSSVLNATRLPKATILLSLSYLSIRLRQFSAQGNFLESHLIKLLTVSLILGSKFLDDNTFQNKSWAEVSNLAIPVLNSYEREWLTAFEHRLHHDPTQAAGYMEWEEQWAGFQKRAATAASVALRPLDSNIRRQRSTPHLSANGYRYPTEAQYPVEPMSATSSFGVPGFGFDWYRGAVDRSPSSAAHSGPATPEYYGPPGVWNSLDNRRLQYGYYPQYQSGPNTPHFPAWNCHGYGCRCGSCQQPVQTTYQNPLVVG